MRWERDKTKIVLGIEGFVILWWAKVGLSGEQGE